MSHNLSVTIDKFLSFWSQHTTSIIEALFAVVILFSLFLAYRNFFGKKSNEGAGQGEGQNLDTAQLEKTLQKILEHQSGASLKNGALDDLSAHGDLEEDADEGVPKSSVAGTATGGAEVSTAELAQLRTSLSDSAKKIEILQAQLQEAQQSKAEASQSAGDVGAAGGSNDELNAKLRDLEARLAEYEIISEDIADLSRYRDENDELKKQIEALKAGGASASASAAPAEPQMQASPTPEPEPIAEPAEAPVAEKAPEPIPEPESVVKATAPASEPTAEPTADEAASADLIDDELMKEFAAAVEGQKEKGLEKAAKKAGDGTAAPISSDDTDKLMDQFENFVTKKS